MFGAGLPGLAGLPPGFPPGGLDANTLAGLSGFTYSPAMFAQMAGGPSGLSALTGLLQLK